ncbi:MAG: hypothetical protein AAGF97_14080 [Planctomycetota bacterium]
MIGRKWTGLAILLSVLISICSLGASEGNEGAVDSVGILAGKVTLVGEPLPPRKIVINKDVEHCGEAPREVIDLQLGEDQGVVGAVVEIQGIDPPTEGEWEWTVPKEGYVLRQKGCHFEPALIVMPSGETLTVYNDDKVTHNVNTGEWNSMQAQGAEPIEQMVSGRSPIRVTCNIHSWMESWIYPARSPFFAVTDEEGNFEITDVPPGKYRAVVWHPALGRERLRVEIKPGETTTEEVAIESPN